MKCRMFRCVTSGVDVTRSANGGTVIRSLGEQLEHAIAASARP